MRTKFSGILTLLLAFVVQVTFAQTKTVTGTVTDADGLPLPGVNIIVKGTSTGTQSDFDGEYSIEVSADQTLQFKYLGFKTQEVEVGNQSEISVSMEIDSAELDEVVVEAYRTSSKKKSNVAAATVTSETIKARPNSNFVQTLQGQIPGLNIQTGSGQPGASSSVILRGVGSVTGGSEPLYVIDGVPQNGDIFRSLNPNEIENISVLKDAGATAIYGNRGANGVIVVTTRSGSYNQALQIDYIATTGFSELQDNDYNLMGSQQLLRLENQRGVGLGGTLTQEEIDNYSIETDWYDVFFRKAFEQSHTLQLTSGGENLNSFTSIGFTDQEGILKTTGIQKFSFRNNLNGKSEDGKFTYGTNMTINWSQRGEATSLGTGGVNQNFVLGANNSVPYLEDGVYAGDSEALLEAYNNDGTLRLTPYFLEDKLRTFSNDYDELKAIASGNAAYQITDELSFSTNFGLDYTQSNRVVSQNADSFNSYLFLEPNQEFGGTESHSQARTLLINFTNQLKYVKTIDEKHTVEASLFTEYFKGHRRTTGFTQNGLDPKTQSGWGTGYIGYDNTPFYVPSVNAGAVNAGLFSYFGFVDYDYDSKYGFSASLRRDASYRFSETNRWGTYYSVSGRWNLSEEDFLANSDVVDALKLRASYGVSGNQNIVGTSIFDGPNLQFDLYGAPTGYGAQPSYGITTLGNSDLRWEDITQANIGVDFEMFESRLRGSADVYQKTTTDLYQPLRISAINAITQISANLGELENKGVEFQATYDVIRDRQKDLLVSVNFNGAYNENKITEIPDPSGTTWDGESLVGNFEGQMLNEYYVLDYVGVNPVNGNLLFRDAEGELTENPDPATDRQFTGESFIPKFQGGFGLNVDYKGFFLTSQFNYVGGISRYDYDYSGLVDPANIGIFNMSNDINRAWTPDNRFTDIPRLGATNRGLEEFSNRFLKDASYLRLRFLSIGYNFSPEFLEGTFIKNLRVFAQGQNLLTWTEWRGWDAESNRSADQYQYPTPRIYNVGLELKF